jgi:hypothetical protein
VLAGRVRRWPGRASAPAGLAEGSGESAEAGIDRLVVEAENDVENIAFHRGWNSPLARWTLAGQQPDPAAQRHG